jgi:Cu-Zn family superoxide dismutase
MPIMSAAGVARFLVVGSGLVAVVALGGAPVAAQGAGVATAQVHDGTGRLVGTAMFTPTAGGLQVTARFQGLAPGQHGIHVHTTGACDPPDFMTAGGHFNPTNKQHGLNNPQGPHVGDLPNLEVGANGTASFSGVLGGASLGSGATSLLKENGTALVIHQDPDDEMTDPAGNSGPRVACGLIVAQAQAGPAQVPSALPRTGDLAGLGGLVGALGGLMLAGGLALRRARQTGAQSESVAK